MTKDEYIESLRKLKPTVYMFGEKVENVVDNPRLRAGIEATGATYELAEDPEYRDLIVTQSTLIDEPINRFNIPPSPSRTWSPASRSTGRWASGSAPASSGARAWTACAPWRS